MTIVFQFFKAIVETGLFAIYVFWVVQLDGGAAGCFFFTLPVILSGLSATAYGNQFFKI